MQTKDLIEYEVIMTTRLDIESKSNFTNIVAESFNWENNLHELNKYAYCWCITREIKSYYFYM